MKTIVSTVLTISFLFISVAAQDNAQPKDDSYKQCITDIRKTPQNAYEPCKEYLEKYPPDNPKRIERIKDWTTKYEKVLPYIQYLQGLTTDNSKAAWFVYEPDMNIRSAEDI